MSSDYGDLKQELKRLGVDVLQVAYADVLGMARSKYVLTAELEKGLGHGPSFCQGVWVTTNRGGVLDAGNIASDGLQDFVTKVDPRSLRKLPYEDGVACTVVDSFNPDGTPNQFAPRTVLKKVIEGYAKHGLVPIVGPELEFYLAKNVDGEYSRTHENVGFVYTTGSMVDPDGTFLRLLRAIDQMDLGAFAGNHEFSPSQYEINLWHGEALDAADRTFLFKNTIKDMAYREGKIATFMGKPWNDEGGSGFHLHFSVTDNSGNNKMHDGKGGLSSVANFIIAGILENAAAITAFANPTVNAFKRLGPDTLAPFRANWGMDNRSCMVRIPPEREGGTRLEVRVGDGAANPYLLIAAILAAGLDGIERELKCPDPAVGLAYDMESAPILPMSFKDALDALESNSYLKDQLSPQLVEAFLVLKREEIERYENEVPDPSTREVTRWEQDEYLLHF
jgi:glutamine synthetase